MSAAVLTGWWATPARPASERADDRLLQATLQRAHAELAAREQRRWAEVAGDRTIAWERARGHLAILIDDVGRELAVQARLQALPYRLSFSILPGSPYAAGAQARLRDDPRRPREIWLHLPMEPLDPAQMAQGDEARERFLLVGDDDPVLGAKLAAALQAVPHAIGVNNHMGSRLTADCRAMAAVVAELVRRGLAFVDSRTTAETCALAQARAAGLLAGERQVFLDHDPSPEAIRAALWQAARLAEQGPTIAIGHPSSALAEVLESELERLFAEGIAVYGVAELLARAADRAE